MSKKRSYPFTAVNRLCSLAIVLMTQGAMAGWDEYVPVVDSFCTNHTYALDMAIDRSGNLHGVWVEMKPTDLPGNNPQNPILWDYSYYYGKMANRGNPLIARRLFAAKQGRELRLESSTDFDPSGRPAICQYFREDVGRWDVMTLFVLDSSREAVRSLVTPRSRPPFRSVVDSEGRWHLLCKPGGVPPGVTVVQKHALKYCVQEDGGEKYQLDIPHQFDIAGTRYLYRLCFTFAPTADGDMLICIRVGEKTRPPDRIVYFTVDREAQIVADPRVCSIREDAFRRIPGVSLPKLEMTELPESIMVLSAPLTDQEGEDCVYQLRFSSNGKLLPGTYMEESQAYGLGGLESRFIPRISVDFRVDQRARSKYHPQRSSTWKDVYIYGFDDEGNLYHYKTEIEY